MRVDQFHRRFGGFRGGERVNNNPASIALNQRHIGQIIAANLVNPVADFEQAVKRIELGLPPQAWVHRIGARAFEIVITRHIPNHRALSIFDNQTVRLGQKPTLGKLKVIHIFKRQTGQNFLMRLLCGWRGGLAILPLSGLRQRANHGQAKG